MSLSAGALLLGLRGEPLILASLSPRRRDLLRMLGIRTEALAPDVVEGDRASGEGPGAYVERLARAKAEWVPGGQPGYAVLGADTVVFSDGEVLEKPDDEEHARRLLHRLSDRWHEVYTGICVRRLGDEKIRTAHERSRVRFGPIDEESIGLYLATGEHRDKAGAYGIQGYGGLLVQRIEGCYFNVMGLPLYRLRALVKEIEAGAG